MWGSCYKLNDPEWIRPEEHLLENDFKVVRKVDDGNCVYPFGQDPAFSIGTNGLVFSNSVKMKMSVIVGVLHMTFGIIIKIMNTINEKSLMNFFAEGLSGLLILWGLFGWMDAMIFFKFFAAINIDDKSDLYNTNT